MNNVKSNHGIHTEHSKLLHLLLKVCKKPNGSKKNNPQHLIKQSSIDYQTAATQVINLSNHSLIIHNSAALL